MLSYILSKIIQYILSSLFKIVFNWEVLIVTSILAVINITTPEARDYLVNIFTFGVELISISVLLSIQIVRLIKYLVTHYDIKRYIIILLEAVIYTLIEVLYYLKRVVIFIYIKLTQITRESILNFLNRLIVEEVKNLTRFILILFVIFPVLFPVLILVGAIKEQH